MKRSIILVFSIFILACSGNAQVKPPVVAPVDTTHYFYDTTTTLVMYMKDASTGETATHWVRRITKSKMDWVSPTKEELEQSNQVTLHKQKTAISSEYYLPTVDPFTKHTTKETKIIALNDFGLTPEAWQKAAETVK